MSQSAYEIPALQNDALIFMCVLVIRNLYKARCTLINNGNNMQ